MQFLVFEAIFSLRCHVIFIDQSYMYSLLFILHSLHELYCIVYKWSLFIMLYHAYLLRALYIVICPSSRIISILKLWYLLYVRNLHLVKRYWHISKWLFTRAETIKCFSRQMAFLFMYLSSCVAVQSFSSYRGKLIVQSFWNTCVYATCNSFV